MIEELSGVTPALVRLSLDALLLRHEVIAHNIANVSTEGYTSKKVAFEEYLSAFSLDTATSADKNTLRQEVDSISQLIESKDELVYSTGEAVEIDKEMIELTETVLKYRALLEANSKRGEIMRMAIRGRGGQ